MKRNFILLLLCFVASIGRSEEYYYQFTSNPFGKVNNTNYTKEQKTAKLSDVTWTLYSSYIQGTNYLQVSTAAHADDEVTLVSESSFNNVSSVAVKIWSTDTNNREKAVLSVKVGEIFFDPQSIEKGNANSQETTISSSSPASGKITISITQSTDKSKVVGVYIGSIRVVCNNHTSVTLNQDSDNTTIISDNNGKTVDVNLDRKFTADGGWYTLCLPFAVSNDQLATVFGDGVRVESLTAARKETDGTTTLVFTTVSGGVEAGKAYLVKPTETAENPVFSGVTLSSATPQPTEVGGYTFVGTYGLTHLDPTNANYRLLGGNDGLGLYRIAADDATNLKGTRGYFVFPSDGQQAAEAKVAVSVPTDIHSIIGVEKVKEGIYTLQGVKIEHVDHLPAGVYISNGKKILVK